MTRFLLLTLLIPIISFSQKNFDPYSLRTDIDEDLKERLYEFAIGNDIYSQIVKDAKSNFTWISDNELRQERIKDKIIRESYSFTAIIVMKDNVADTKEESDLVLLNFGNEMNKEKKDWEALHKKIWALLY